MGEDLTRRPTILDVARRAGVSRAAVSRVIRDAYGVSAEMRAKVEAAVAELGYRPLVAARGLRSQTYTIGLAIPNHHNTLRDTFFNRVVDGILSSLAGTRYNLIVAPSDATPGSERTAIEALADRQVDGLVAHASAESLGRLEELNAYVPVVGLGVHSAAGYDTLVGDDRFGAGLAVRHLYDLGHRSIYHLTSVNGPHFSDTPHRLRVVGYQETMRDLGLEHRAAVHAIDEADQSANQIGDSAHSVARRLLEQAAAPIAIFAGNDALALAVLRAMAELGLAADQVSVVGYDDTDVAAYPLIDLTSVDQDGHRMGVTAVRLLLERIGGRRDGVRETITPHLTARASSRPPRR
ncbi:MAG: LacI family transcriptional regulator [Propionibacteriaceae bacterium]|jgi:LacI family transcriptional regulator|nr:LacI family transcriptional regulator [Propionibacteriaceae bacterium]